MIEREMHTRRRLASRTRGKSPQTFEEGGEGTRGRGRGTVCDGRVEGRGWVRVSYIRRKKIRIKLNTDVMVQN